MRALKNLTSWLLLFLISSNVLADEGMWMLNLIGKNISAMQTLGLKLTAEDIYSVNKSRDRKSVV